MILVVNIGNKGGEEANNYFQVDEKGGNPPPLVAYDAKNDRKDGQTGDDPPRYIFK